MKISSVVEWSSQKVTYTWIPADDLKKFQPIKQAYGVCVNDDKETLIYRAPGKTNWNLPGGTPEGNESPIETLKRELIEEVDIEVERIKPLGVQKVVFSDGVIFYQARFYCKIKKILSQTVDPATGLLNERKFVKIAELNKYLKWGEIGEAIAKRVVNMETILNY
ncbi:MAG: NUDIX hydrolase [Candidatus Shapirobacteria bacterium]|jgi:ADP-ribose pyrophosphatase YjhB (NUDIX family)